MQAAKIKSKLNLTAATLLTGVMLAGCGTQSPAPVISGFTKLPWEPERRVISSVPVTTAQPDFSHILPAAGPVPMQTETLPAVAPVRVAPAADHMAAKPRHTTYRLQSGDTLYNLASSYDVSVVDILEANNVKDPSQLKAGQMILIPSVMQDTPVTAAIASANTGQAPTPQRYSLTRRMAAAPGTTLQPTVQPRQTVQAKTGEPQMAYSLTRSRFGSTTPQRQARVVIAPQAPVQVQQPVQPQPTVVATASRMDVSRIEPAAGRVKTAPQKQEAITYVSHRVNSGETLYRIGLRYGISPIDIMAANNIERPQNLIAGSVIRIPQTSSIVQAQPAVKTSLVSSSAGLVWPAQGQLLTKYGQAGDGVTHTGINIALAENTPVIAADGGTVIYADDGLKSYGNLVLLRHNNGMVTAYGHNNTLKVQKNQRVKKGQVIALSGATGSVSQPQLHFEVRKNAQSIDPLKVLPKL